MHATCVNSTLVFTARILGRTSTPSRPTSSALWPMRIAQSRSRFIQCAILTAYPKNEFVIAELCQKHKNAGLQSVSCLFQPTFAMTYPKRSFVPRSLYSVFTVPNLGQRNDSVQNDDGTERRHCVIWRLGATATPSPGPHTPGIGATGQLLAQHHQEDRTRRTSTVAPDCRAARRPVAHSRSRSGALCGHGTRRICGHTAPCARSDLDTRLSAATLRRWRPSVHAVSGPPTRARPT